MSEDHGERLARVEARLCALEKRTVEWLTKTEFWPVRMIVYALAGGILLWALHRFLDGLSR